MFAETPGGDPDNVVMAGGHLDSVHEGPGINDNGSGTTMIAGDRPADRHELKIKPKNKIRFAFWGAEEAGLVGSKHYVDIAGQRRGVREDRAVPELRHGRFAELRPFRLRRRRFGVRVDGARLGPTRSRSCSPTSWPTRDWRARRPRSTAAPTTAFILNGVPSGGLFSGAEGTKTEEQEAIYGGVAGLAYDPCYHQACDTFFNTSDTALNQFSNVMAHVIDKYGRNTSAASGRTRPRRFAPRPVARRPSRARMQSGNDPQ